MDDIQKGNHAARILEDEIFQEAVEAADERFVRAWRDAETTEDRERAHAMQAALAQVLTELRTIAGRGEFARERLARDE